MLVCVPTRAMPRGEGTGMALRRTDVTNAAVSMIHVVPAHEVGRPGAGVVRAGMAIAVDAVAIEFETAKNYWTWLRRSRHRIDPNADRRSFVSRQPLLQRHGIVEVAAAEVGCPHHTIGANRNGEPLAQGLQLVKPREVAAARVRRRTRRARCQIKLLQ